MPGNLPDRLGPYQIGDRLGAGGMGEVYRARDTRLERDVAVKVILPERSEDATLQSRFAREARAASALNHPNIVCIYDVGEQDGTHYIVSELVHGESLRQMISRGPLPSEQSLTIAMQIADALKAAARRGNRTPRSEARKHHDHRRRARKGSGFRTRSPYPANL